MPITDFDLTTPEGRAGLKASQGEKVNPTRSKKVHSKTQSQLVYKGVSIAQQDDGYVNLTDMLQAFNLMHGTDYLMSSFLKAKRTQDFIAAMKSDVHFSHITIVKVVKGNSGNRRQGTWGHPDLAIKFAAWLSPAFEVWAMRMVRAVLTGEQQQSIPVSKDASEMMLLMAENTRLGLELDTVKAEKFYFKDQFSELQSAFIKLATKDI